MEKEKKIERQVSMEIRDEEYWNRQILKYNNRLRKMIKDNSKNKKNFSNFSNKKENNDPRKD
jgi:hypothetical protein